MRRLIVLAIVVLLAVPVASGRAASTFLETFDGAPAIPTPWHPANWSTTTYSRDANTLTTLETTHAGHGTDCAAPPATHDISAYDDAVFQCKDHIMTAIKASGYALIYLTPDQIADFSSGEVVIKFDISTLRTSDRDWTDIWVTPFNDNLQLALEDWLPAGNGHPRNAIHARLVAPQVEVIRNFVATDVPRTGEGYETALARAGLTTSATRRDTFELHISRTHVRFGMPAYNFWPVDANIADLGWTSGVIQLGHHSYNPSKSDGCGPPPGVTTCTANTWHWDNVGISPAVQFSLLNADLRRADATHTRVTFAPAPANAHLRFIGVGRALQFSTDNGATWVTPQTQAASAMAGQENFRSYWTPVPAGTQAVLFRGSPSDYGWPWIIRDISIWSLGGVPSTPSPTSTSSPAPSSPLPTASPTAPPTPSPSPSQTPTASIAPTASPTPISTPSPTPFTYSCVRSDGTVVWSGETNPRGCP
jgi:hypothetical protein